MNRDEQLKELLKKHWEKTEQEAELVKLGLIPNRYKIADWIPCSERLPEEGVDVLVWFEYFRYGEYNGLYQKTGISYTYKGDWSGFVNGQSGWHQLRVIAWMPLPEPYKENNNGNETD